MLSYQLRQKHLYIEYQNGKRNDAHQIPMIIIHPSLQIEVKRLKNSVNPGWVEPDLNYILLLGILSL